MSENLRRVGVGAADLVSWQGGFAGWPRDGGVRIGALVGGFQLVSGD
jgi:hypothetical protein